MHNSEAKALQLGSNLLATPLTARCHRRAHFLLSKGISSRSLRKRANCPAVENVTSGMQLLHHHRCSRLSNMPPPCLPQPISCGWVSQVGRAFTSDFGRHRLQDVWMLPACGALIKHRRKLNLWRCCMAAASPLVEWRHLSRHKPSFVSASAGYLVSGSLGDSLSSDDFTNLLSMWRRADAFITQLQQMLHIGNCVPMLRQIGYAVLLRHAVDALADSCTPVSAVLQRRLLCAGICERTCALDDAFSWSAPVYLDIDLQFEDRSWTCCGARNNETSLLQTLSWFTVPSTVTSTPKRK